MVIYKTTNLVNGKFYIGKDSKNDPKIYFEKLKDLCEYKNITMKVLYRMIRNNEINIEYKK